MLGSVRGAPSNGRPYRDPGRKLILGLGANDRSAKAFARLHGELFRASA